MGLLMKLDKPARLVVILSLAGSLLACASSDKDRTMSALTAPLADVNLLKVDIPPLLSNLVGATYSLPSDNGCAALAQDIADLDALLGNDIDTEPAAKPSLVERGQRELRDATFDTLRSTSESVIPFRGWVRKLSGAERHSHKVQAAIEAGSYRRSFLKGLRTGQGCSI